MSANFNVKLHGGRSSGSRTDELVWVRDYDVVREEESVRIRRYEIELGDVVLEVRR